MLEQQFVTFLISRINAKLSDVKKQTIGESVQIVVDELQIYVDQLEKALETIVSIEPQSIPVHVDTTPQSNRRRRSDSA